MKTVSLKKEVYQECLTWWGDLADWSEPETAAIVVMEPKYGCGKSSETPLQSTFGQPQRGCGKPSNGLGRGGIVWSRLLFIRTRNC